MALSAGSYLLTATADSTHEIDESDETNNALRATVTVMEARPARKRPDRADARPSLSFPQQATVPSQRNQQPW
ncbi:MAG: hypothetical protein JW751_31450 [Polyangiaceae bacterium]|nr:hypothetical protein [Polyangiaceae bacterium]